MYLHKEKSEIGKTFKDFCVMVENQFQTKIRVLRTNNGKEYLFNILGEYLSQNRIIHESACFDTPLQNRIAKRNNRHLLKVARVITFATKVLKCLWGEIVCIALYLINHMPKGIL